jgi:hypothetical protein
MTHRISDGRLLQIYQTGACLDVPRPVWRPAFVVAERLLAAADWRDLFMPLASLAEGRFAAHAYGRWVVSFAWAASARAHDLALERIKI